jgi:hypothetical protein
MEVVGGVPMTPYDRKMDVLLGEESVDWYHQSIE